MGGGIYVAMCCSSLVPSPSFFAHREALPPPPFESLDSRLCVVGGMHMEKHYD